MRDFLDSVLVFIGLTTITDQEAEDLDLDGISGAATYENMGTYLWLVSLLAERVSAAEYSTRLVAVYRAKGISVVVAAPSPSSNIFLGGAI